MRPARRLLRAVLLVVIAGYGIIGCARSRGDDAAAPAANEPGHEQPSAGGIPMRLTEEGRQRQAANDGPVANSQAVDPRDAAFNAMRLAAAPLYPVDYWIGSLRTSGLSQLERAARERVIGLLSALEAGGTYAELLIPDAPRGVRRITAQLEEQMHGATQARVGRPERLVSDEYSVAFRFQSGEQLVTGEAVVALVEGRWYISDVQVTTPDDGTVGPFVPDDASRGSYW